MLTLDSEDVSKVDGVLGVAVGAGRLRQLGKKPKHAGAKGSDNGVCWPQLLCPASHLGWNSSSFARLAPAASGAAPCHSAAPTPQQHLEDEGVLEDDVGQAAGQHIDRRQQEPPQHNLRAERAAAGRSFRMAGVHGGRPAGHMHSAAPIPPCPGSPQLCRLPPTATHDAPGAGQLGQLSDLKPGQVVNGKHAAQHLRGWRHVVCKLSK